jgi:hypothetical protein
MGRWRLIAFLIVLTLGVGALPAMAADDVVKPTFHKDIEPILQRSCQRCHNPNSVAPMSLITYQQVRPYAREVKRRTALRHAPWSRDAMPPWFLERNIGIQKMKDDVSLTDEEIDLIGRWVDSGAPEGDPKDAPPALKLLQASEWALGKPDLIVSSPVIYLPAIASDWSGSLGKSPIPLSEDRYAMSAEYKEVNSKAAGGGSVGARFVFHHGTTSISGADQAEEEEIQGETAGTGLGSLPIHEVGRNGDVFPHDAGKLLPAGGYVNWGSMHVHSVGTPGSERYARLDIGFRLHPKGYKPTREDRGYSFGWTDILVHPNGQSDHEETYFIAPQAMKLTNFEPHMHANGVRMCLQAISGKMVETLDCAGYDHNWVRNYQYEENYEPIIPKGTILRAIGWFDNSSKNANVIDPRNAATFGNSSVDNMLIMFNHAEFLTDEQYKDEVAKRKEFLALTHEENIGCPACYLPMPKPAKKADRKTETANKTQTARPSGGRR